MYILGINLHHPDASAVLIYNGQVVAALEEERFRRIKHFAGFPTLAIRRCLEMAGIQGKDLSAIAVGRKPKANLLRKSAFVFTHKPSRTLIADRIDNLRKVADIKTPLAEALSIQVGKLPKIHHVEHHSAHLASAFFVSGFDEAAVCALDGFGDFVSTSMAFGRDRRLKVLERIYFPHSLGMLYTAVTQYLGFQSYGDEFKVMGLAPYGEPHFVDRISRLVRLKPNGLFELDLKYFRHWSDGIEMEWEDGCPSFGKIFSPELDRLLGPPRLPEEPLTQRHEDIARSLQEVYETCAFHVLNSLWKRTKSSSLCLAGGCAMNSVANGKIRTHTPFEKLYIQPAASDNGTALGAAYFVWRQRLGNARTFVMDHAFWGTSYEDVKVESLLLESGYTERDFQIVVTNTSDEICRITAGLLADGNIVGWFQGRMEWGARALGNRSILADARRADVRDVINAKIKFREKFRPFAPSVLEESIHDYFVDAVPDPFMQQVYAVREDKRHVLPAITHVDGTGRLQTVNRSQNPLYYKLIEEFRRLTGVPVLLNTSFNENEPIVDTPSQALDCFLRTQMDALVAGNTIVMRPSVKLNSDSAAIPSVSEPSCVA